MHRPDRVSHTSVVWSKLPVMIWLKPRLAISAVCPVRVCVSVPVATPHSSAVLSVLPEKRSGCSAG